MNTQSKRDLIAAIAVILMFAGAFMLSVTLMGFVLIGAAALTLIGLFVTVALQK